MHWLLPAGTREGATCFELLSEDLGDDGLGKVLPLNALATLLPSNGTTATAPQPLGEEIGPMRFAIGLNRHRVEQAGGQQVFDKRIRIGLVRLNADTFVPADIPQQGFKLIFREGKE